MAARSKRFYLCNLFPLWEIDDEHLEVDWDQEHTREEDLVEMRVMVKELPVQIEPLNFDIKFEINESDFLLSGGKDDKVVTLSSQPAEGAEHRPLKVAGDNEIITREQKLKNIFASRITLKNGQTATLIQAYWKALYQEDVSGDPEYYFDVTLTVGGKDYLERSDHELTVSRGLTVEVIMQIRDPDATTVKPLSGAWIYWREDSELSLFHTDITGRVFARDAKENRTHPWVYTESFSTRIGRQVQLFYSRGTKPLPESYLKAATDLFQPQVITAPASQPGVSPAKTQILITLPNVLVRLISPQELSLCHLLWELPALNYLIDGIPQGPGLWTNPNGVGNLVIGENDPANPPPVAVRPRERAFVIKGEIDAKATGVKIKILKPDGNHIPLRERFNTNINVPEIAGTLQPHVGPTMPFEASIFLANPLDDFGPVQIVVEAEGLSPRVVDAFAVHLCGVQIALVDDYEANINGQQRGPIKNESNEVNIIDFLDSPQATLLDISGQTQCRRMIPYRMANQQRLIDLNQPPGPNNPLVLRPQMPMWMAEFQIIGLTQEQLQDLMAYRYFIRNVAPIGAIVPASLNFELQWRMTLSWDGPDINSPAFPAIIRHNQTYSYNQTIEARQVMQLYFGARGQLVDDKMNDLSLTSQGEVPNAFLPMPTLIPFPVPNRRLPRVILTGQNRAWRRQAGAPSREALIIEFQPRLVNAAGVEMIRGGNGVLELRSLIIDGSPLDLGLITRPDGTLGPAPAQPVMQLPEFRVRGLNPAPRSDTEDLIDACVEDYYNRHHAQAHVASLPLACWQVTTRRILFHESGYRQFEYRPDRQRRLRFGNFFYGHELDMPFLGPPHGYGVGQLDGPPVNDDEAWSFVENIRRAVRRIFDEFGREAYNHIRHHLPAPLNQRIRAVHQRELVRKYNGGVGIHEFIWDGTDWVIHPNLRQWRNPANHAEGPYEALLYPNRVLHPPPAVDVVYYVGAGAANAGAGAATVFNWPITFTPANYGPDT